MDSLSLRLPKELIEKIDNEAENQERSRPQQIRFILNQHYGVKNKNANSSKGKTKK